MAGHKLEEAAQGAPLPQLVSLAVAGPLDDAGAIRCGPAVDIETQTAVAAHDVEKAAADIDELPVLPRLAVGGELADARAGLGVGLLNVQHLAAVAVGDAEEGSTAAGRVARRDDVGLDSVFGRIRREAGSHGAFEEGSGGRLAVVTADTQD